jgi:hypothetical protein
MDWLSFIGRGEMLRREEVPREAKMRKALIDRVEQWLRHCGEVEGDPDLLSRDKIKLSFLCRELEGKRDAIVSISSEDE